MHHQQPCPISDQAGRCITSTGIPCALTACSNAAVSFLEGHYRSTSFPDHEQQRALNTLRYIHANPKTAGMRKGYFYAYSNCGI
jgi:hypothetical protein